MSGSAVCICMMLTNVLLLHSYMGNEPVLSIS